MKKKLIFLPVLLLFIISCGHRDRLNISVSDINIPEVKIHRYDKDLFKVNISDLRNDLQKLQGQYMFFLATNLDDPSNLASMKDYLQNPRNINFAHAVDSAYKDMGTFEKQLTDAFRHVKYYYPSFRVPRVYTYISGGDYENSVTYADSVILIAIDTYLGKDFKPYLADGIPVYKTERMISDQIVPDCMRAVANVLFPMDPSNMTLLEQMTEAGKRIYLTEAFIPDADGDILMKYPKEQYDWVKENEPHVWAAIIENKMLYSTEGRTIRTFMADGPFTPEFSKASPPRLGEWIGLQIIRAYMNENPDVSMSDMLNEKDVQGILQHSGYKPEK